MIADRDSQIATGSLIARVQRGDRQALHALLVQQLPSMAAYVRLRAGGRLRAAESVADLVQSACVEVLGDLSRFEFRGVPQFRHWLCKQALHKIINKQKFYRVQKRDRRREVAAPEQVSRTENRDLLDCYATICTPSRHAAAREELERFEAAFEQLEDEYREAITLRRIVGLSYRDIGAAIGRTESAARSLVYRGLARLTGILDGRI